MKCANSLKGTLPFILCLFFVLQGCQKSAIDDVKSNKEQISSNQIQKWNPNSFVSKTMSESYPTLKSVSILQVVNNGGFEDGFSGWNVFASGTGIEGDISKAWYVGVVDPYKAYYGAMKHYEQLPHSGANGATAVENGPTFHQLYQDVTIPKGIVELRFWIRWKNEWGYWSTESGRGQNIQVNLKNIKSNENLVTLFDAKTLNLPMFSGGGDIIKANYEQRVYDISAYAGQTVRLEFISDVQNYFMFVDLDDIEIVQIAYPAELEIKPYDINEINLKSKGNIPVALLSDLNFDATTMDLATITLGDEIGEDTHIAWKNNGTFQASFEDVNGDGLTDLMMHFDMGKLITHGDLVPETTFLKFNGFTIDKQHVIGMDDVIIVK